jgi:hypothetical protein
MTHEIEPSGHLVFVHDDNRSYICTVSVRLGDGWKIEIEIPPDMPDPARAALRQWLADRIVIEEVW